MSELKKSNLKAVSEIVGAWKVYEKLISGADDGIDSGDGLIQTVGDHEYMLRPKLVEIIKNCPMK